MGGKEIQNRNTSRRAGGVKDYIYKGEGEGKEEKKKGAGGGTKQIRRSKSQNLLPTGNINRSADAKAILHQYRIVSYRILLFEVIIGLFY